MEMVWLVLIVLAIVPPVSEAALPDKGAAWVATTETSKGITRGDFSLKISSTGRRLTVRFPQMCRRTLRGTIRRIAISREGRFSARREYSQVRASGEVFEWSLKFAGRFANRSRADGRLTAVMRTRSSGSGGVQPACRSPRNAPWTARPFVGMTARAAFSPVGGRNQHNG
jgi:hypothetical protein